MLDCCLNLFSFPCTEFCFEEGVSFHSFALPGALPEYYELPTAMDCARKCFYTKNCNFFTFNKNYNRCFLKTKDSDRRPYAQAVSGGIHCQGKHLYKQG